MERKIIFGIIAIFLMAIVGVFIAFGANLIPNEKLNTNTLSTSKIIKQRQKIFVLAKLSANSGGYFSQYKNSNQICKYSSIKPKYNNHRIIVQ